LKGQIMIFFIACQRGDLQQDVEENLFVDLFDCDFFLRNDFSMYKMVEELSFKILISPSPCMMDISLYSKQL